MIEYFLPSRTYASQKHCWHPCFSKTCTEKVSETCPSQSICIWHTFHQIRVELQFSNLSYLYCSSTLPEIFESDSSDQDPLEASPPKASKSCAQHFEDVLGILHKGRLSPFDLMVELLDDSNLKYWAYRTELYKEENQKLSEILDLVFSNGSHSPSYQYQSMSPSQTW